MHNVYKINIYFAKSFAVRQLLKTNAKENEFGHQDANLPMYLPSYMLTESPAPSTCTM